MKKTTLYLLMLMASFSWLSLSAQIPGGKFKFEFGDNQYNANSNYSPTPISPSPQINGSYIYDPIPNVDANGNTVHEDFTAIFKVDLTTHNKSEGDIIYIFNKSDIGAVNNSIWDINWHYNSLPLTSGSCPYIGTYVETDLFDQSDLYGLPLTIPTYGGVSNSQGEITHNLWLAPGNFGTQSCESAWWSPPSSWQRWVGLHNTCETQRTIKIEITVKDVPECFESQTICPGVILDMNVINPNGYTASNWSPFNPTIEGVDETTTFSVDLESTYVDVTGSTVTNSTTCTFQVDVINPEVDLVNIDMLCAEDLPYSIPFYSIFTNPYEPLQLNINGTLVYNASNSYFNQDYFYDYDNQQDGVDFITITQAGTYSFDFVYQVYVDGVWITCSKTYELTIHEDPEIVLPQEVVFCGNNFDPICIPNPPANYLFTWQNPVGTVYQSSSNPCFTPTQYGNLILVVSHKNGCEYEYNINVLQGSGPKIKLKDILYCREQGIYPNTIGLNYSLLNVQSYSWTYNGAPLIGLNGTAPNGPHFSVTSFPMYTFGQNGDFFILEEGTYCLTVTFNDGCQSKACFRVKECCEANPEFDMNYVSFGINAGLTVQNNPSFTPFYSMETFTLYKWCKGSFGWQFVDAFSRSSNFNDPYTFNSALFNAKCMYKVVHQVWTDCHKRPFVSVQNVGGNNPLPIIVYPNPPEDGKPVTIEMTEKAGTAQVEITNLVTGEIIFTGNVEFSRPLMVENSIFTRSKGGSFGMFNVKVYNSTSLVNKKIIVR